jgi:hypothetical protein
MNRAFKVTMLIGAILVGTQAIAQDTSSQPALSKRQMVVQIVGCMRKEMAVDRSISYNAAAKACKDQVSKLNDHSASGTLVAAATPVAAAAPAKP